MAAPVFTAADFLQAMQNLMPRGRAWPRDLTSLQAKVLGGLAPSIARVSARDNQLIVEALPSTTTELLGEWEESLGLPDPCAGGSPTVDERRAQVVARFANDGGQSAAFFIAYAATLGYVITIDVHSPFRFGMRFGLPLNSVAWAFTWTVNAPLAAEANEVLECEFNRLKPAYTYVNFIYS
jgi:uncharacterized protein YmfQ (DUF2313 family)